MFSRFGDLARQPRETRPYNTRRIRFLAPMTVAVLSQHRRVPPYGMAGGEPGERGSNAIERADGTVEPLNGCDSAAVTPR